MNRPAIILAVVLTVVLALPALAGGNFGDWDSQPAGPYSGDGDVTVGNPLCVQVVDAGSVAPAPPVPGGAGTVLCIDARNKGPGGKIIVSFTFSCDILPNGVCQVKYGFSAYNTLLDAGGFEVHVDAMGEYDNPDDTWVPVGLPPMTTFGSNTETEGACDGSSHTIDFVVLPGTVLYLDDATTLCLPPVPVQESTWGHIKALYSI